MKKDRRSSDPNPFVRIQPHMESVVNILIGEEIPLDRVEKYAVTALRQAIGDGKGRGNREGAI